MISLVKTYSLSLSDAEIKAIKNWIKNTVVKPLAESAISILEADKEEVELMVARNAFILEEMKVQAKNEGRQEGVEEKAAIGVKNMLKKGMASEEIAELLEVSVEFVEKIKAEISK